LFLEVGLVSYRITNNQQQNADARYKIYMGRDKIENEELIKYGLPEDIWFVFYFILKG